MENSRLAKLRDVLLCVTCAGAIWFGYRVDQRLNKPTRLDIDGRDETVEEVVAAFDRLTESIRSAIFARRFK